MDDYDYAHLDARARASCSWRRVVGGDRGQPRRNTRRCGRFALSVAGIVAVEPLGSSFVQPHVCARATLWALEDALAQFALVQAVSSATAFSTYPIDTVRRQMMVVAVSPAVASAAVVAAAIFAQRGWPASGRS